MIKLDESNLSAKEKLALLPVEEQRELLSKYTDVEIITLMDDWFFNGRPKQLLPLLDKNYDMYWISSGRGFGKLNPLDTPIKTTKEWKTIGTLLEGDYVFDEQGNPTKVIKLHQIQTPEKSYRFWFNDGSHIDSGSEHLWASWTARDRKQFLRKNNGRLPLDWVEFLPDEFPNSTITRDDLEFVKGKLDAKFSCKKVSELSGLSTSTIKKIKKGSFDGLETAFGTVKTSQEIFNTLTYGKRSDINHCIPNCSPLKMEDRNVEFDPYWFGLFCGDGLRHSGEICGLLKDLDFYKQVMEDKGYTCQIRQVRDNFYYLKVKEIVKLLKYFNFKKGKYILDCFINASVKTRLEFIQGFMDTDGTVNKNGTSCEFTQSDKKLAECFYEILISLGMKATISSRFPTNTVTGRVGKENYRITFSPTLEVFKLPRKANKLNFSRNQISKRFHRMIVKAELIQSVPMRCITVDSPNSMFLIGKNLIPTHNSRMLAETVIKWADNPNEHIALLSPTAQATRDIMVLEGIMKYAPKDSCEYQRSKSRVVWKNGAIATMLSGDSPDRIRGFNFSKAAIEEISSFRYPESYDMLLLALRAGGNPQHVIASTPKPNEITFRLLDMCEKYPERNKIITGSTYENMSNLPEQFIRQIQEFEGTALGDQEIHAIVMRDIAGALFRRDWIQTFEVYNKETGVSNPLPEFTKTVLAVDIATTSKKNSDFTALAVVSKTATGDYFVREVEGVKKTPKEWAEQIVEWYFKFDCDEIVVEVNQGGDMVAEMIRSVKRYISDGITIPIDGQGLPIKEIVAYKGKRLRAELVSNLYQRKKVWHFGNLAGGELVKQMLMFTGQEGRKDDLLDSVVYAIRELAGEAQNNFFIPLVGGQRSSVNLQLI